MEGSAARVAPSEAGSSAAGSAWEVLGAFTRLGLTSFGGPVAHLGYFRAEFVARRRWLDDATYADLVALCQFLPGPASSQVGIALGLQRAGLLGALAAWTGFTLPSAIVLTAFALGVGALGESGPLGGVLHGLKVVAVAVVAQAVWGMARTLCPDRPRATLALAAAGAMLLWPHALAQLAVIAAGALIGWRLLPRPTLAPTTPLRLTIGRGFAVACLAVLAALLVALPIARELTNNPAVALADAFFRVGALVFGGGHVVLPMLQAEVVPPGWVSNTEFVAGYGAAQAVPGPLFTFAAYLGAVRDVAPSGVGGAAIALVAMFVPAFLLVLGALPFWEALRARAAVQSALAGINAAVVGLLLAALYTPVWTSAIAAPADFALALAAFGALTLWGVPPWLVVVVAALLGLALPTR